MTTEEKKRKKAEYREAARDKKYGGNAPSISSEAVVKMYGLRVIVGTFDKHNPTTAYLAGTINCEGTNYDGSKLRKVGLELRQLFDRWITQQDDFCRQYIRVVDVQDQYNAERNYNHIRYKPKSKHIKFDITVKLKQQLTWKEVVEVARRNVLLLYDGIVKVTEENEIALKDFQGHNLKKVSPVATEEN